MDMMKRDRIATCVFAFLGVCLAMAAPGAVAAGMYKWTDEKGIVHYSDQMPPEAVNKGTVVMDKQAPAQEDRGDAHSGATEGEGDRG